MNKLTKLYKTSAWFVLTIGIIELVIAYGFASLSIDRGNLWWYLFTIIFLIRGVKDLFKFVYRAFPWKKIRNH